MSQTNQLYLGRLIDAQDRPSGENVLYPLEHLTTHGLLLGATGSGKTGLGLVLVEEVLRQNVPVLLLDVKGDLADLLLTFPDLAPEDFAPWIDADRAQREGNTAEAAAEAVAQRWREGLAQWDLGSGDVADLRRRAELALYTPGSRSGRPVDVLARFGAPPANNPDELALRAQGLASALLGLAGVDADPIRSREHILLTTLIRNVWDNGGTLDVPTLIQQVQQPPVEQVGVFDLESFFPAKERFMLALTLNNLVAAPGFALWREGEPLDIDRFLYAGDGRPRATVFYLAHLPEEQRHFFVTLFLEELRTWVRRQAGTRTLRAMLYFDEIFGYLPPHPYNPPSKGPLLALLKQARAAGLGVLLSTQNPGDLDYKALSNIGLWAIGALRTDRDKRRVMEGMEGAIAEAGLRIPDIEADISRLKPRLFLLHDARSDERDNVLRFFHSRWAMAYLRGPLTIAEVQRLAPPPASTETSFSLSQPAGSPTSPPPTPPLSSPAPARRAQRTSQPPAVNPDIPQAFLPATITAAWAAQNNRPPIDAGEATLVYRPHLLGIGVVHIRDDRSGTSFSDEQAWRIDPAQESWNMRWEQGQMSSVRIEDLSPNPPDAGQFEPLPGGMGGKTAHTKRESAFKTHLYNNSEITLWNCAPLKLYSNPGETKAAFVERCRQEVEKQKEAELAQERRKFEQKMTQIQGKMRKEELEMQQEEQELEERKREELLSGAESVLSLFSRRRKTSRALSQASRQHRYVQQVQGELEESKEMIKHYQQEIDHLEETWQTVAQGIAEQWRDALTGIGEVRVRAKRNDLEVRFCGLVWFPFWEVISDSESFLLPAYVPAV